VPVRPKVDLLLIFITGVSIYIVPPLLFKILTASYNAFSSSSAIVIITSDSDNVISVFFNNLHGVVSKKNNKKKKIKINFLNKNFLIINFY
jgi:hypothetical protein